MSNQINPVNSYGRTHYNNATEYLDIIQRTNLIPKSEIMKAFGLVYGNVITGANPKKCFE
jgi:LysM repeat protein